MKPTTHKINKHLQEGLYKYLENTTIHGFNYVVKSKHVAARVFWVLNVVVAFLICFVIVGKSLEEADAHPTTTESEEVDIEELLAPAVSILAPKNVNTGAFDFRVLNPLDACDPELDVSEHGILRHFLPMIEEFNGKLRLDFRMEMNETWSAKLFEQIRSHFEFDLYPAFCSRMEDLNAEGQHEFVLDLEEVLDSKIFVINATELLVDKLGDTDPSLACSELKHDSYLLQEWMILTTPIRFRSRVGYICHAG